MDDPQNYHALVPAKIIDAIEAYLVLDKPFYLPGSDARAIIVAKNYGSEKQVSLRLKLWGSSSVEERIRLPPNTQITHDFVINIPEKTGEYSIELEIDGKTHDKTIFYVEEPARRKPFYFTFVWHHHQAPNYDPDGRIHSPWAYTYVWDDHLAPYGKGPYHYHSVLLMKHQSFRSTYNLSPSLLQQWLMLLEKGIEYIDGRRIAPDSPEAELVRETIENYVRALKREQIDVLTSIYAHTIAGFLTDILKMHDIVDEEIKYGKEITVKAMGGDYNPLGIWTPEMAFSMSLVPIYSDNGIKYTVLDDQHHFRWAEGDKDSQYEPYILVDPATRKNIVVFFRDHYLSNILGFHNNFYSEPHAWRNAYETALQIARKWHGPELRTLVLALDGENWMVFPRNKQLTAYYLDRLIIYLESLQDQGFIKLSTLEEMYNEVPSKRVLTHIPTNTWLGTFRKWRGEIHEHEEYWRRVNVVYQKLKAYEEIIRTPPGGEEYSKRIRWALWHALDSDYWWAEFWKPDTINKWLGEADKLVSERLSNIRIKNVVPKTRYVEDSIGELLINVENRLDKEAYLTLTISGPCVEMIRDDYKPIKIKPSSSYSRSIPIKTKLVGSIKVNVSLIANRCVIDSIVYEIVVEPMLPPNPV